MEKDKKIAMGLAFLASVLLVGAGILIWVLLESGKDNLGYSGDKKKPHLTTGLIMLTVFLLPLISFFLCMAFKKCYQIFKPNADHS